MPKNAPGHVAMSVASTLASIGCVLVALSLGVDSFMVRDKRQGNKRRVIWRGILKDCHKEYSHIRFYWEKCFVWSTKYATSDFLRIHHDLMLALIGGAIVCAAISIAISVIATLSNGRKYVYAVISFEAVSGLLGLVASITYAAKFIYPPWRPSVSLFLLIIGTMLLVGSTILHCCVRDAKFFGKECCQPPDEYDQRYEKKDDDFVNL